MNSFRPGYYYRLMAAVALLSVALIGYQVAVIQLLSYVQWYHFANVVISVALLGFGAAGALLSIMRNRFLRKSEFYIPVLSLLSALTMLLAVDLSNSGFSQFDSYLLFTDRSQWFKLLLNCLLFFIPFLFGALALGIVFIKYVEQIGRFYFSNLVGSGIGAVLAAIIAWYFFPVSLSYAMSLFAVVAGLLMLPSGRKSFVVILSLVVGLTICYRLYNPITVKLSEYKSLSRTMNLPGAKITLEKPGPYGLVQVVTADALRYAPGLSLLFDKEVPVKSALFNNGDWYGPLDSWNRLDSFHLLDYTTMNLPYVLAERKKVLLLSAGNGLHVSHARSQDALHIDAVESHRGVNQLLLNDLAAVNDSLFHQQGVSMHLTEPRTYLSSTNHKYDLIQLPQIGSFGGGVGLYAMREEYILAKEAFMKMWDLLDDNGVISITTWMDYPFRNSLKLIATLRETLNDTEVENYQNHIAAVRSWATISFIIKKSPLTDIDTTAIRKFCNQYSFDPLFLPGVRKEERTAFNGISDSTFFSYADELLSGDNEKLYRDYGFHIRPATDDKPYFSQFLRWKSFQNLAGIFGSQTFPFLELGWLIAAISFLQVSVLAVLLIILPLFKIGWGSGKKSWTLIYFAGLGAGYMLLEIVLIQKFILFFGNPVYAAAFVICIMMLSSGAGSFYSTRLRPNRISMQRILLSIFSILFLYTFLLSPLLNMVSGNAGIIKLLVSLPIVAIPAYLMGMPFPLGLRNLAVLEERNVPWAWGINGCVSVISASLAALLAVEAGFSTVIMLAACFYFSSFLSMYLTK